MNFFLVFTSKEITAYETDEVKKTFDVVTNSAKKDEWNISFVTLNGSHFYTQSSYDLSHI